MEWLSWVILTAGSFDRLQSKYQPRLQSADSWLEQEDLLLDDLLTWMNNWWWLWVGGLSCSQTSCLIIFVTWQLAFPKWVMRARTRQIYTVYNLAFKITLQNHISQIMFIKRESLNLSTFNEREIKLHLLKSGISKNLWTNFKTSTFTHSTLGLSIYIFNKH